jgi:uncharacterized protein YndB with AHSA1/START domain
VFADWTNAEHLGAWFAPAGFDVVDCRAGGCFRVEYRSSSGELYVERGQFIEIVAPERLRFTLINENERGKVMVQTEVRGSRQIGKYSRCSRIGSEPRSGRSSMQRWHPWGLIHMYGPGVDMWSRGTRIFQKVDGGWQMIHQHLSFPYDPGTGAAKLDPGP